MALYFLQVGSGDEPLGAVFIEVFCVSRRDLRRFSSTFTRFRPVLLRFPVVFSCFFLRMPCLQQGQHEVLEEERLAKRVEEVKASLGSILGTENDGKRWVSACNGHWGGLFVP